MQYIMMIMISVCKIRWTSFPFSSPVIKQNRLLIAKILCSFVHLLYCLYRKLPWKTNGFWLLIILLHLKLNDHVHQNKKVRADRQIKQKKEIPVTICKKKKTSNHNSVCLSLMCCLQVCVLGMLLTKIRIKTMPAERYEKGKPHTHTHCRSCYGIEMRIWFSVCIPSLP